MTERIRIRMVVFCKKELSLSYVKTMTRDDGKFFIEPDICPNMLREERKHSEISKIKLTKYSILHTGKKNSLNEGG